jgi:probable HAF family extracellular repeat protein
MKSGTQTSLISIILFTVLAVPGQLSAQAPAKHRHYKLIDLGTLGGPTCGLNEGAPVLNRHGAVTGTSATSIPNPYFPNGNLQVNFGPLVAHGFKWHDGVLTDLGALPHINSSLTNCINDSGVVAGQSENGILDPVTGFPEMIAIIWKDGKVINLGTLGGSQSFAACLNDLGQVVGGAQNAIPDQNNPFGFGQQMHAFLWQNGQMHDLGTLGGPDSIAFAANDRGQVIGFSYTDDIVNPNTGAPTTAPFLWERGKMVNLGTLGDAFGQALEISNRGQVIGTSNTTGDVESHPFLWDRGQLKDLGTLGGTFGNPTGINDAGEIAGWASLSDDLTIHAVSWRNGIMTDLGTLAGDRCSLTGNVNAKGQIVGMSFAREGFCFQPDPSITDQRAVLWENGAIVDLGRLIPSNSPLHPVTAVFINDRGEIVGGGVPPGVPVTELESAGHAFLLMPCDENHPGIEGCDYSPMAVTVAFHNSATIISSGPATTAQSRLTPRKNAAAWRAQIMRRYHIPVPGALPRN